jgi:hypothetical protein
MHYSVSETKYPPLKKIKVYPNYYILKSLFISVCILLLSHSSIAQKKTIQLKNGELLLDLKSDNKSITEAWEKGKCREYSYLLLFFREKPTTSTITQLKFNGIELLHSVGENVYEVAIKSKPTSYIFQQYGINGIATVPENLKISPILQQELNRSSSEKRISVSILLQDKEKPENFSSLLEEFGFTPVRKAFQSSGIFFGTIEANKLKDLAETPGVKYINLASAAPEPLNFRERGVFGTTMLTNAQSGRKLSGSGVVVGVGDNADPSSHIDLQKNVINRSPAPIGGSAHGTHVAGVVSGDGLIEERWTGSAAGSTIVSDYFDYVIAKTDIYIDDYGMTVTNNSYYNGFAGCVGNGDYNELSVITDIQIKNNPFLQHIFAAGNDGALSCSPYPNFYGTIKSGYQTSKNVLSVGNCDIQNGLRVDPSSSRGPVKDGRIKPEIVASGTAVAGTNINNGYREGWGTSYAAPFVSGIWSLLSERYKQLYNRNPKSGLLKSILCNTATDKGRPGPDYENGFGWIHPQRALKALEEGRYLSAEISQGQTQQHSINIPAGCKQVKIMLYWHDPAGLPYAKKVLQHDIDLRVTDRSQNYFPWVLDTTPNLILNSAIRGIDRLNNIEQVTIQTPGTSLQVEVNGFDIVNGPQEYFITWDFIEEGLQLLHPIGGERFTTISTAPTRLEAISWEATDTSSNPFTIEYSLNNGNTWTIISSNVGPNEFRYFWSVPDVSSSAAKIRVSRNGTGLTTSTPGTFSIIGIPTSFSATVPCEGYVTLTWNAVPNASDYEVLQLKDGVYENIATVTTLTHLIDNLDRNTRYWFTVRPRINDSIGKRMTARSIIPALSTSCSQAIFNNDMKIDTLLSPGNGRIFTSTQLNTMQDITLRIKNLDNAISNNSFSVYYQINNGDTITETINTAIAAGGILDYTFATKANFSSTGTYTIRVGVKNSGDNQPANNDRTYLIKHLDNPVINLPFTETFETAGTEEYRTSVFGIPQIERFDFLSSTTNGRYRSYVNKGMTLQGNRSAFLDAIQFTGNFNTNTLTSTYNLSQLSSAAGLRLDFLYKNQGQLKLPNTTIWVRGKDTSNWVLVKTIEQSQKKLDAIQNEWINLEQVLNQNNQSPGSSFQIRIIQQGRSSSNNAQYDPEVFDLDDGYSFDNIRLSIAENDLSLQNISSPDSLLCNSGNTTVRVNIRNNSNVNLNNIPVSYRLDNLAPVTETIAFINANSEYEYSFSTPITTTSSFHQLDAWLSLPQDNYKMNDSILDFEIYSSNTITSFPYLQSFEDNDGGFYTTGTYESWQWGQIDTMTRSLLKRPSNGNKGIFTSLYGTYKPNELSYLYSPCFNLSQLTNPVLSFAHFSAQENNRDFHTIEYSTNNGMSWQRLGTNGEGTNWFDAPTKIWNTSLSRWHTSSIDIPVNAANLRFRFLLSSDAATQREGIGIDDIHIFERETIYEDFDNVTAELPIQGNDWIDFKFQDKMIASINPLNQNLGKCSVSLFMNIDTVRAMNNQYYIDRNYVIKAENNLTDSVLVRVYFTEAEVKRLLAAGPCINCTRFTDPFRASVTQYKGASAFENNILNDGTGGTYTFYDSTKVLILPYNNGYLAEWKTRSLGEIWIHANDFQLNQTPVSVTDITNNSPFIKNTWFTESGIFNIQVNGNQEVKNIEIRLFNGLGQEVFKTRTRYQNQTIPLGEIGRGLYVVEIIDMKKKTRYTQKLIRK